MFAMINTKQGGSNEIILWHANMACLERGSQVICKGENFHGNEPYLSNASSRMNFTKNESSLIEWILRPVLLGFLVLSALQTA